MQWARGHVPCRQGWTRKIDGCTIERPVQQPYEKGADTMRRARQGGACANEMVVLSLGPAPAPVQGGGVWQGGKQGRGSNAQKQGAGGSNRSSQGKVLGTMQCNRGVKCC